MCVCVCFGEGTSARASRNALASGVWKARGSVNSSSLAPATRRCPPTGTAQRPGGGALRRGCFPKQVRGPCAHPASSSSALSGKIPVCRLNCMQGLFHLKEQPGYWSSLLPATESRHAGLRSSSYLSGGAHPLESAGDFISYQSQRAVCIRTLATEAVLIKRRIWALAGEKGSRGNLRTSTFPQTQGQLPDSLGIPEVSRKECWLGVF